MELPTWFIMDFKGGDDWLRPSHPMSEEREVDEYEEVTYAIASRVPECAYWNLLDNRNEEGVPLMTVVEWLRLQVDQDWMQAVMTRVLLRARWMDKVCQGIFFGWKLRMPTTIVCCWWNSEASPRGYNRR